MQFLRRECAVGDVLTLQHTKAIVSHLCVIAHSGEIALPKPSRASRGRLRRVGFVHCLCTSGRCRFRCRIKRKWAQPSPNPMKWGFSRRSGAPSVR